MGTGDLAVQNELLPTTNGPINEDCNWPEDAESDISIGTEDLASTSELHATTNGPVTAVELVFILTPSSPTSLRPCKLTVITPYRMIHMLSSQTPIHPISSSTSTSTES